MSNKIVSLITGDGQDTVFLAKLLLSKEHEVIVASRRSSKNSQWKYKELSILDNSNLKFVLMDLNEFHNVNSVIKKYKPDYIFHLAAQSFVQASFENPILTSQINAMGALYLLEAVRNNCLYTRIYNASTSEMFGKVQEIPQVETTPFYPRSPYGVAKLFAHEMIKNYRESYNIFACSGILFNHESCFRGSEFVTKKIVENVVRISNGEIDSFELGNVNSKRDWGFAGDYVEAMYLMLQQDTPDDFVISTGETHTIKEFVEKCFEYINNKIEWIGEGLDEIAIDKNGLVVVRINPEYFRPSEVEILIGNSIKAKNILGWEPKYKFKDLIKHMMDYELKITNK